MAEKVSGIAAHVKKAKFIDEKEDKISDVKHASQAQRNKQSEVRESAEKFTVVIDKSNE